jgi:hypothetical protein
MYCRDNTVGEYVTPFDTDVYLQNYETQRIRGMLYIIFPLVFFNKESNCGKLVRKFNVTVHMYLRSRAEKSALLLQELFYPYIKA